MYTRGLFTHDDPARRVRWGALDGTTDDVVNRERPRADPVREPARVGHLVDGVDIAGPYSRGFVPWLYEQVVGHLVQVADIGALGLRGVLRLGIAADGVVAIEVRSGGRHGTGAQDRGEQNR